MGGIFVDVDDSAEVWYDESDIRYKRVAILQNERQITGEYR